MIKQSIALCLLSLPNPPLHAQSPVQKPDALSGTWFGDFVLTSPDGKVSHDKAVLILDRHGSALAGSIGRTVDQQTPIRDGRWNRNGGSFHLDGVGGLDFVLALKTAKLTGTATGGDAKATISLKPAPGLCQSNCSSRKLLEQMRNSLMHLRLVTWRDTPPR